MSASKSRSDDQVGYGNPPYATRFQKGTSGNPKGRPPKKKRSPKLLSHKDRPAERFFQDEAYRTVTLREGDKQVDLTAIQALERSMITQGIKGHRLQAQFVYKEVMARAEAANKEDAERYETLVAYKRVLSQQLAEAKVAGKELPRPYPHPDDILVDAVRRDVHILGPTSPEMALEVERQVFTRDLLLAHAAIQEKAGDDGAMQLFYMQAQCIHDLLPPSYGGGNETALIRAAMHWHDLGLRAIRRGMSRIRLALEDLPPPDIQVFMEEREAKRANNVALLDLIGTVMEAAGKTEALTEEDMGSLIRDATRKAGKA